MLVAAPTALLMSDKSQQCSSCWWCSYKKSGRASFVSVHRGRLHCCIPLPTTPNPEFLRLLPRRVQLQWPKAGGEARRSQLANQALLQAWVHDTAGHVLTSLTVHNAAQVRLPCQSQFLPVFGTAT